MATSPKCPGKNGKTCPSGKFCAVTKAKNGKVNQRCLTPDASCKKPNAKSTKIVRRGGQNVMVCKPKKKKPSKPPSEEPSEEPISDEPADEEPSTDAPTDAPTEAPVEPETTIANDEWCSADDGKFKDESGLCWPTNCTKLPPPEKNWFATNSEIAPCYKLTKVMFSTVKQNQDREVTVPMKCAWDYILCFLFACYPGKDPTPDAPAEPDAPSGPGR